MSRSRVEEILDRTNLSENGRDEFDWRSLFFSLDGDNRPSMASSMSMNYSSNVRHPPCDEDIHALPMSHHHDRGLREVQTEREVAEVVIQLDHRHPRVAIARSPLYPSDSRIHRMLDPRDNFDPVVVDQSTLIHLQLPVIDR